MTQCVAASANRRSALHLPLIPRKQLAPAAVHAGLVIAAHLGGTVAEALEVAMLEVDDDMAVILGEPDLDRRLEIGVIVPVGVELPGEEDPVGPLPIEHLAPILLAAV